MEVVKSTGSCLGQLLFNNREKFDVSRICSLHSCNICSKNLRPDSNQVAGKISSFKYRVDTNLNCDNCGIYRISCPCSAVYIGKNTTRFGKRFDEHFRVNSSVFDHSRVCALGRTKEQYTVQFLENSFNRGKYTLSEREYLWNERLGGELNVQKILRKLNLISYLMIKMKKL